jgi:nucleoside-diphosphate-sugar epimerase
MRVFLTGAAGFVGGSVARRMVEAGYVVRGLVRSPEKAEALRALDIEPVIGDLDDHDLLVAEARLSDGVINAASSDHPAAIGALIEGLKGSGKPLLHTSGSSVIGDDARGNVASAAIFNEQTPFVIEAAKQPRRDIDLRVLAAADQGVRSVVVCPSNIYGVGTGLTKRSFQIPFLVDRAKEDGYVTIVGAGLNRWSNVHIADICEIYLLAFQKAPAGSFYFAEAGETSFGEIGEAIAERMKLAAINVPAEDAAKRWGELHAFYTFGSNSRVRAVRARRELGWSPANDSMLDWIRTEMPV